jgi:hypothetical protein
MVGWSISVASGECLTGCLLYAILTNPSASKLQDGVDVTLIAEIKATDQHIVCHVMCDDIGKFRNHPFDDWFG